MLHHVPMFFYSWFGSTAARAHRHFPALPEPLDDAVAIHDEHQSSSGSCKDDPPDIPVRKNDETCVRTAVHSITIPKWDAPLQSAAHEPSLHNLDNPDQSAHQTDNSVTSWCRQHVPSGASWNGRASCRHQQYITNRQQLLTEDEETDSLFPLHTIPFVSIELRLEPTDHSDDDDDDDLFGCPPHGPRTRQAYTSWDAPDIAADVVSATPSDPPQRTGQIRIGGTKSIEFPDALPSRLDETVHLYNASQGCHADSPPAQFVSTIPAHFAVPVEITVVPNHDPVNCRKDQASYNGCWSSLFEDNELDNRLADCSLMNDPTEPLRYPWTNLPTQRFSDRSTRNKESLVPPLPDPLDRCAAEFYSLLLRHLETKRVADQAATQDLLAFLRKYPLVGQVHFRLPDFASAYCLPLAYFAAISSLEGCQLAYRLYPEAIGMEDDFGLPLHYACYLQADVQVVSFLLARYGEAAKRTNQEHQTPLHLACQVATPGPTTSSSSSTSLDRLVREPNLQVLKVLLEHYPTASQLADREGNLPLHWALQTSGISLSRCQALAAPKPHHQTLRRSNRILEKPLHVACRFGVSMEVLSWLLEEHLGAAKTTNERFETPLHAAVLGESESSRNMRWMQALVRAFPDARSWTDERDERPVDSAIRLGAPECIVSLLSVE
jgi:ankyrin repeat protein